MSAMRQLDSSAVRELAPHALAHPRPFLAELIVAPEHLSRLIPHANNAEYVHWLDRVAELHAEHVKCGRASLIAANRAWFVARHEVDYLGECWEGERLVIATWVRTMRKTTSWRDTLIVRPGADGAALICRASTLWAYVDLATRRPSRAPVELIEAFDVLERDGAAQGEPARSRP